MKVNEILAELRSERQQLDEAILILERIDQGRGNLKRRGRPPGSKNNPKLKLLPLAV